MKFYTYIPRKDGTEPVGTEGRTLFELKTVRGAIRRATRCFGGKTNFRLFHYQNLYDDKTFREVYDGG